MEIFFRYKYSEKFSNIFARMIKIITSKSDVLLKGIVPRTAQGPVDPENTTFWFKLTTANTSDINKILIPASRLIDGKIFVSSNELKLLGADAQLVLEHYTASSQPTLDDGSFDAIFSEVLPYYLKKDVDAESQPDVSESIVNKIGEIEDQQMKNTARIDNLDASVNSLEATSTSTLEKVEELDQNISNIDASVNEILAALPNHLIVHPEDWLDCNTWRTNGFVRTNTETVNVPEGCFGHYGMLLWVSKSDDDVTGIQVFTDYSGGGETCRSFVRRFSRTNDEWGNWYRYANNIDIENLQESIASTAAGAQQSLSDAANQLWTVYHELNGRTDTLSDAVTDLQHQIDNLPTGEGGGSGPADTTELEKTIAQILSAYHAEMEDNELASAKAIANLADQLGSLNQILESI